MINFIRKSVLLLFIACPFISNSFTEGIITKNISNEATTSWENRMLGGFSCTTEQFPFVVLIVRVKTHDDLYRTCGGSLLNEKYVLTAAHCLEPNRLAVLIGLNAPDTGPIRREVIDKISHPHYHKHTLRDNIGLLLLDKAVSKSDHIVYVNLPDSFYKAGYLEKRCKTVFIMGWGHTTNDYDDSDVDDLPSFFDAQCALLKTISNEECKSLYSPDNEVFEENICTLSSQHIGLCQEDSGGPIICDTMQVGIISGGLSCEKEDSPGVYIRVDRYLDFINRHLSPKRRKSSYRAIPRPKPKSKSKTAGSIKCNGIDIWFYMMPSLYLLTILMCFK